MKRKSLKLIACAAIMAMTLSVTACGGSDETAPAAETEETTEVADEAADEETDVADEEAEVADEATDEETEVADEATDEEAEAETTESSDLTVESLLSDPAVMAQFEEGVASYEEQGMSVTVEAKGNELILSLMITDSSLIQDGAAEQLEAGLDDAAASFEVLAGSLDQAVSADAGTCTYTVRYLDPDSNVLAERSFTAQ